MLREYMSGKSCCVLFCDSGQWKNIFSKRRMLGAGGWYILFYTQRGKVGLKKVFYKVP